MQVGQGGGGGALQGRARRQPRPGRHVPVDHQVGPAQLDPGLAERPRHPGRVGGPALDPPRPDLGQLQVGRRPGLQRPQPQPAAGPPAGRDQHQPVDRGRQHEAVVVVGVLPDQVDPPRGRPDALGVAPGALGEGGRHPPDPVGAHRGQRPPGVAARSSSAACSGAMSLMNTPAPDSLEARYFSLAAAPPDRERLQVDVGQVAVAPHRRLVAGQHVGQRLVEQRVEAAEDVLEQRGQAVALVRPPGPAGRAGGGSGTGGPRTASGRRRARRPASRAPWPPPAGPSASASTIEQERQPPVASRWARATSSWRAVRGATNG